MRMRFTEDNVEPLTPARDKQQVLGWDKDCPGLGIRITSKNRRS